MKTLIILFVILSINAYSQDSVKLRLVIEGMFERELISGTLYNVDSAGNRYAYIYMSDPIIKYFKNFFNVHKQIGLSSKNQLEYFTSNAGTVFLIIQMSVHYRDDINLFVVIDKVKLGNHKARVKFHTSSSYTRNGKNLVKAVCWLQAEGQRWSVTRFKISENKCCDEI